MGFPPPPGHPEISDAGSNRVKGRLQKNKTKNEFELDTPKWVFHRGGGIPPPVDVRNIVRAYCSCDLVVFAV